MGAGRTDARTNRKTEVVLDVLVGSPGTDGHLVPTGRHPCPPGGPRGRPVQLRLTPWPVEGDVRAKASGGRHPARDGRRIGVQLLLVQRTGNVEPKSGDRAVYPGFEIVVPPVPDVGVAREPLALVVRLPKAVVAVPGAHHKDIRVRAGPPVLGVPRGRPVAFPRKL